MGQCCRHSGRVFRLVLSVNTLTHPRTRSQWCVSLLSFAQSSQLDSHGSTFTSLTSMPDFSTAAANLWTLSFSPGQDLRGGYSPPPVNVRLSTALRGLPNLCLSSSDTIYHDCKFSVIKMVDFQTGPEYEPRGQLLADRQGWRASGLLSLPLSLLPGSLWLQKPAIL